jgi:hypothetical protein
MGQNMAFLFKSPRLKRNRGRSVVVSLVMVSLVVGLLFVLPAPLWTLAEGVTWPSDKSQVRAEADGFITELLVEGKSPVQQGQPIIRTRDPLSQTRVKKLELHKKQLEIQLMAMQTLDRVQADIVREELKAASENLERAREQVAALVINSPRDGIFFVPKEPDQVDRFVRKGEIIAYVTNPDLAWCGSMCARWTCVRQAGVPDPTRPKSRARYTAVRICCQRRPWEPPAAGHSRPIRPTARGARRLSACSKSKSTCRRKVAPSIWVRACMFVSITVSSRWDCRPGVR